MTKVDWFSINSDKNGFISGSIFITAKFLAILTKAVLSKDTLIAILFYLIF